MTPQDLAKAYAETIYVQANGLGQHVHLTLGRSDHIMRRIYAAVGEAEGRRLIQEAMARVAT
jgi:hypothetical protein